ncbi:mechanosensitive ion channel family protein [Allokutzneria sp. A3M-2-11 16]|uniref:mechanosensitive ion channel family protein n=1 Tax=Allokutzneria sp. A3M-2-11 16 TaxID=2962043 RepID=UPI0020B837ED|nr:mechanosensitive ion channel domain-containing protein [Allokutzneria sp. A3M-2-11 16]
MRPRVILITTAPLSADGLLAGRGGLGTRSGMRVLPLGIAVVTAVGGLALTGAPSWLLDPDDRALAKILLVAGTVLFLVGGVALTRLLAADIDRRFDQRGMQVAGSIVKIAVTVVGYVLVALTALGLMAVPVQQLLLGGAITGVVVGIAAQQTLANVFAGLVVLFVRPFKVGDTIEVRSGALNGPFTGRVIALGLTYVTLSTEDGTLLLPNSGVLASGLTVNLPSSASV